MLNRKRKKQILYDTEGSDLVRPDLNKPTDQPVIPIPITPIDPIIPSAKVPSAKGEIPTQNKANLRPGGFDPLYRFIDQSPQIKKPTQPEKKTPQQVINDRPEGVDKFYRHMDPYNRPVTFNERKDTDKKPGSDAYYRGGNIPAITDPMRLAAFGDGKNITDAEGLRRAYESQSSTYVYKGVEYVAGTKGGLLGSDMRENFQYIGIPNIKSAITYNLAQIGAIASSVLPEIAAPALVGLEVASMFGRPSMSENIKKEMDVGLQVENLTRFKDAEKTYLAFRRPDGTNYIQRLVGDSSGGAVISQMKAKYNEIEGGRSYGAPVVDVFARSKMKNILQDEKATRDAQYGNDIKNIPEKIVNDAYQGLIEKALGLDNVKSVKDTGIEQIRLIGDPVASLNNSATTLTASIDDILSKNTLTHSYDLTASNFSTSKDTTRDANGWTNNDKDKTTTLFQ